MAVMAVDINVQATSSLCNKFWTFLIDESPEFAVYRGINHKRGTLDSFSLTVYQRRKEFCEEFLRQLDNVAHNGSTGAVSVGTNSSLGAACGSEFESAVSARMLKYYAEMCLTGLHYQCHLMHYNYWEGVDVFFLKYTLQRLQFETAQHYDTYVAMLKEIPRQVKETVSLLEEGLRKNMMPHRIAIVPSVISRLQEAIDCPPVQSPFYQPFTKIPSSVAKSIAIKLQETGIKCVTDVQKTLQSLKMFLQEKYIPRLRENISINSIANPAGLYEALLRYYCSVDLSPTEIHNTGSAELVRLQARLKRVMSKLNFTGTQREFFTHMQSMTHLYFSNKEDLMKSIETTMKSVIRPRLDKFFSNIPDYPLSIQESPHNKAVAKAVYNGPPLDGAQPGLLWVSANQPQRFTKYELITLMLHEAEPGHHLQACVALKNTHLPLFRKLKDDRRYSEAPGRFPSNDAYTEGWGLYCEELGYEMGLYEDPYAEYGNLCYDLIRTVRMIVDTGIHALGWDRAQAEKFMFENTGATASGIELELDRYITWPGHACSYKIGQLKIKELRAKAEKELGAKFDLRHFHDVCLQSGQVPLAVLDDIITAYISRVKRGPTDSTAKVVKT